MALMDLTFSVDLDITLRTEHTALARSERTEGPRGVSVATLRTGDYVAHGFTSVSKTLFANYIVRLLGWQSRFTPRANQPAALRAADPHICLLTA